MGFTISSSIVFCFTPQNYKKSSFHLRNFSKNRISICENQCKNQVSICENQCKNQVSICEILHKNSISNCEFVILELRILRIERMSILNFVAKAADSYELPKAKHSCPSATKLKILFVSIRFIRGLNDSTIQQ